MIIGIDIGSTNTKVALMDNNKLVEKIIFRSSEDYLPYLETLPLKEVTQIVAVGTGASYIEGDILGIPTTIVEEFKAVARGGHYLSKLDECLVVSVGTGTSFVYANSEKSEHAGGCGIGGALLSALSSFCLNLSDIKEFLDLALTGDMHNIDLQIQDISKYDINELYAEVTAANMAKLSSNSKREDIAAGIANLVFQNIGVMAYLADKVHNTNHAVMIGTPAQSDIAKACFKAVSELFNFNIIIPDDATYAVAIGATFLV